MALRQRHPALDLRIWTRQPSSLGKVRNLLPGALVTCSEEEAVRDADGIVFCTPVGSMPALAEKIRPYLREGCFVTDAGSVKGFVMDTVGRTLGSQFVGAHPMAGSEQTGIEAAHPDLFEDAPCILTPDETTDPAALSATRTLWEQIGCHTIEMSASEHDKSIARVSHLPHSVASILVNTIDKHAPGAVQLAGGGYRDTTRVAAGAAAMWREILMENRTEVLSALAELRETCEEMESYLKKEDHAALEEFLARAREIRSAVR